MQRSAVGTVPASAVDRPKSPFRSLLGRMSIAQRFFGSLCFFALPLGVLFYFNMDQLTGQIDFARSELRGNQFQRSAVQLIKFLGDYQAGLVSAQDSGNIDASRHEADTLFAQLETANTELAGKLNFTTDTLHADGLDNLAFAALQAKWKKLAQYSADNHPVGEQAEYDQLISDLRGLVSHAGDTSKLTLDPEMDSYYLADVSSVTAAQTLARIGSAMVTYEPLLAAHKISPSTRTALAVVGATLSESDFDRITGDLDTALKENAKSARGQSPTLKAAIEPTVARYKTDVQALIKVLKDSQDGKVVSAQEFHQIASRASQSSLELWSKTITELDNVLAMRIAGFARYRLKLLLGTLVSLSLALFVLTLTIRGVTGPLSAAVVHVELVANGDLSMDLPANFVERGDEIGVLARAMQGMSAQLRTMVNEISGGMGVLSSAASLLQASSTQMSSESRNASDRAHSVAAAAEEMSSNAVSIASGMEQTTINLTNVATATEQMTATIGEIAAYSEKARRVTEEATAQAKRISEQIEQLSEAAEAIGKVTESINEISSQTNLLALNATIEAARAGAAGKGFAVVATEIKALAQQTAAATEDIKTRVHSVQSSTSNGIAAIASVSHVIDEVSEIVTTIAAAIEQQATATRDIARNISEASVGVNDANHRVAQSSQVSREIAHDISTVDHAASEMADGSQHVRSSADELAAISGKLNATVERFKVA